MRKVMFFLFVFSILAISIFAQPVLVVKYSIGNFKNGEDVILQGELRDARGLGCNLPLESEGKFNQLHVLYKNKLITIFPSSEIVLDEFFYDEEDFDEEYTMENMPYTFDVITKGDYIKTDQKTGLVKKGIIKAGDITIEYCHRKKSINLYFVGLKIIWR